MFTPHNDIAEFFSIVPAVLYEYILYEQGNGEFVFMNETAKDILGDNAAFFIEDMSRFWLRVEAEDLDRLQHEDATANAGKDLFISEIRFNLPDGTQKWLQISSKPTSKTYNNAVIWAGYMIDITQRKAAEQALLKHEQELEFVARHDALTGLLNRVELDRRWHEELVRAKRYNSHFSVLMFDLDFFKRVNDTYGHQCGDKVLQFFADILNQNVREADLVFRYGGEEFIVLLPNTQELPALELAERIRTIVAQSHPDLGCCTAHITTSAGVACYPTHGMDVSNLHQAVDMALYKAKQAGRDCVKLADPQ